MEKDQKVFTPTINHMSEEAKESMKELERIRNMENPYEAMKERAKYLNSNLQPKKEIKPSLFSELLNDVSSEALKIKAILNATEAEPKLIFEQGFELTKRRGLLQAIMNSYSPVDEELNAIKGHEFQVYLAKIADQYFQEWLRAKGIDEGYSISVHNMSSYPSNFAIYKDGLEIYRFSLQKKWYGSMRRLLDREGIIKKNQLEIDGYNKTIKDVDEEIALWEDRKAHPLKHYRGLKNIIAYLRMRPQFRKDQFDVIISKKKVGRIYFVEKIEEVKRNQEFEFVYNEEEARKNELIRPFFEEIGYVLNEDRNSMY